MPIVPPRFADLDVHKARAFLPKADEAAEDNRLLYSGRMFEGGRFWLGELPDDETRHAFLAAVEKGFIAINHVKEVVDRHRAGVLKREPLWRLTVRRALGEGEEPTADEQRLIAEAEAALTSWWDARDLLPWLHDPARALLLAGRTVVRLYIPRGLLDLDSEATGILPAIAGADPAAKLAAALEALYVDGPDPALATVATDPDSKARIGVYAYRRGEEDWAEVTHLAADGTTVLRVLGLQGGRSLDAEAAFALGGRLLMYEARREPLVDAQVRRLQQATNLNLTNLGRNLNLAGSRERTFLGAQPPGYYRHRARGDAWTAADPTQERGEFVPGALPSGAGTDRWVQGVPVYDQEGKVIGVTTPQIHYEQPVSVETFNVANGLFREAILGAAYQTHALIAKDATASGESRKQARDEFAASLGLTKLALDGLGRWLVETALALGAALAGLEGRYADLRCQFDTIADAGPITADERREYVDQWQKGGMSLEKLLTLLGEEDVAAEVAAIARDREAREEARTTGLAAIARGFNAGEQ